MNPEEKFHALRQQLDSLDTSAMRARIEANLRLAWAQQPSTHTTMDSTPKPPSRWRWLSLTVSGSALATLALITTWISTPSEETRSVLNQEAMDSYVYPTRSSDEPDDKSERAGATLQDSTSTTTVDGTSFSDQEEVTPTYTDNFDLLLADDLPINDQDYSYTEAGRNEQLFDESVHLSVEVKGDLLDAIHTVRNTTNTVHGNLVSIAYYDTTGTIDVQIPNDQLQTFEDTLEELDMHHKVTMTSYDVQNVSTQVQTIDDAISSTQTELDAAKAKLDAGNLTTSEITDLNTQISDKQTYINDQMQLREATIAKYSLINVSITIQQHQSFWSDHYIVDRSTITGELRYQLNKAGYFLVRSTGKILTFLVWLAVYSIIFLPLFWLGRAAVRKLIKLFKRL